MWRFKSYLDNLFLWRTQILTDLDEHKLGNANKSHISWSYLTTNKKRYFFVFIFKQGKQCKECRACRRGREIVTKWPPNVLGNRQALTMYKIVVKNVIACFVNVYITIVVEKCTLHMYVRTALPMHKIVLGQFFPSTQDCRYVYERRYSFPNYCPENFCRWVSHEFCFTFWLPLLALM